MLFYITLFLIFLYFKIARVHKKEERVTISIILLHILVFLSTISLYVYGFGSYDLIALFGLSFLFFIVAALVVTTIQLGIFIDGKPLLGINKVFKFMPIITAVIVILSSGVIFLRF